jgi:hypothetical protein
VIRLRPILISTAATFAAWLGLCAVIGVVSVEGALHIPRLPLTVEAEDRAAAIAADDNAALSEAVIIAADHAVLRAWKIQPRRTNRDAVILLHGQGDNRAGMLGPANMLLREGFTVLLPDARAHGASGGAIGTYGVLEADDVRRWFEWLKRDDATNCIDGLGDSMGAAELLRSLDDEPGFCAVVAESPFATFREAAYDRLGQQFSTGPWLGRTLLRPAFAAGIEYARLRYAIDFREASPARSVAASHVPVLLIHGLSDANLPPRHSEIIKAGNPAVVLWEPAGADHCGASTTAPLEYERRVVAWFGSHDLNKDRR